MSDIPRADADRVNTTALQLQRALGEMLGARDALRTDYRPAAHGLESNGGALQDRFVWSLARYQSALDAHIAGCIRAALAQRSSAGCAGCGCARAGR
jgi:hypothetical protein